MHSRPTINALIFDDDRIASEVVSEFLRQRGVSVLRTADRVETALSFLDTHQPKLQLVVADIYVPGCDGIEFLDLLCDRSFSAEVVILSGAGKVMLSAAHRSCIAYGLNLAGIVPKRVTGTKIDEIVRRMPSHSGASTLGPRAGANSALDDQRGGPAI